MSKLVCGCVVEGDSIPCVFDDPEFTASDCNYAVKLRDAGKGRDDCEYWKPSAVNEGAAKAQKRASVEKCTDCIFADRSAINRAESAESLLSAERKETERLRELLLWAKQRFRRAIIGLPVRDADELIAAIEKATALQERQGEE